MLPSESEGIANATQTVITVDNNLWRVISDEIGANELSCVSSLVATLIGWLRGGVLGS